MDPSFNLIDCSKDSTILTWTCPSRLESKKERKKERINYEVLSHKTASASPELTYLRTAKMSVDPSLRDVPLFIRSHFKETWSLLEKVFSKSDHSFINKVKKRFQF